MNSFEMSNGERVLKTVMDYRVTKAKAQKIQNMKDEYGYVFCEDCERNDCVPVDCSHDISVKECQETKRSELAWDINNITMRGRTCHTKKDNSDLKFTN